MRFAAVATLVLGGLTFAQAQAPVNGTYIAAVIQALTAANLTSLAGAAQAVANTTEGAAFLAQLGGSNKTLLAPSNDAFAAVDPAVSGNTTLLANILSYHVLNASLPLSAIGTTPNHTVVRSLYNNGRLPANRNVPVVLYKTANATAASNTTANSTAAAAPGVVIQQATGNVNATAGPVAAANFQIYVIDQVLDLPVDLATAATTLLPSIAGVIQQVNLLEPLSAAQGITIFAPSNSAVDGLASTLATLNETQISGILANHVINGTAVFSTQLGLSNYTSAGGEPFTFVSNSTGTFVRSGNATARIIMSDIVIENGVVHVIDQVLVNQGSNATAAASAASSVAAAATATTSGSNNGGGGGVVGATSAVGSAAPGATSSTAAGGAVGAFSFAPLAASFAAVAGGLVVGASFL